MRLIGNLPSTSESPDTRQRLPRSVSDNALPISQKSPPRSPYETKVLYEHALQKAVTETASVTDEIIARQSEILARKHDIAVWQVSLKCDAFASKNTDAGVCSAKSTPPRRSSVTCRSKLMFWLSKPGKSRMRRRSCIVNATL